MKTLELELKKRLLIVELPNNECEFAGLLNRRNLYFFTDEMTSDDYPACFPLQNDCEFICKGSELDDDECEELVLKTECENQWCENGKIDLGYNCFVPCENCYEISLKSFISSIEAQGYYWGENTLDKECDILVSDNSALGGAKYRKAFHEWQEAEEKTFNPSKTLIFEII